MDTLAICLETRQPSTEKQNLSLDNFIGEWQKNYESDVKEISLFNPNVTKNWSKKKQGEFAKLFYHLRGNFHHFLWYIGNHSPNASVKQIVVDNIAEEFSINGRSHELLYYDFSNEVGINIADEIQTKICYLPFSVEFNEGHLNWLRKNDWESGFCAFSAYEKLDNVDYNYLYQLADSFNLPRKALIFFSTHQHVDHFDNTKELLSTVWNTSQEKVCNAFAFIANHQITMWKNLSEAMDKIS